MLSEPCHYAIKMTAGLQEEAKKSQSHTDWYKHAYSVQLRMSNSCLLIILISVTTSVSECWSVPMLWLRAVSHGAVCLHRMESLTCSDETAEITDHLGSLTVVSLKNMDTYLQTHLEQSHSVSNTVYRGFVVNFTYTSYSINLGRV